LALSYIGGHEDGVVARQPAPDVNDCAARRLHLDAWRSLRASRIRSATSCSHSCGTLLTHFLLSAAHMSTSGIAWLDDTTVLTMGSDLTVKRWKLDYTAVPPPTPSTPGSPSAPAH